MANQIWQEAKPSQGMHGRLRWFGLLLAMHVRDERHVNQGKVLMTDAKLELTHRLDKRGRLDVTDGTSKLHDIRARVLSARPHRAWHIAMTNLNDANIWLLMSFVHRNLGDALYPVLDSIRHMGNDLQDGA
jgi:hypothetical protein